MMKLDRGSLPIPAFFKTVVLTVSVVSGAVVGRSQVTMVNGVNVDTALTSAAPETNVHENSPGSFSGGLAAFGPTASSNGQASATVTGALVNGQLDPTVGASLSTTGFGNTYNATAGLTYSLIVVPVGGLGGAAGSDVSVDATGSASVSASGSYYDNANAPAATAAIAGPGLAGSVPLFSLAPLGSLGSVSDNDFDQPLTLLSGDVYTVTLNASVAESADPGVNLNASVDPQFSIDPTFALSNPGYSLAFSPGFPGSASPVGGVPDASSTLGLLALSLGALAAGRRYLRR
jgi:hypothetical protein